MKRMKLIICLLFALVSVEATAQEYSITINVSDGKNSKGLVLGIRSNGSTSFVDGLDIYAPPAPPTGSFDARIRMGIEDYFAKYQSNTLTAKSFRIIYSPASDASPISLTWNHTSLLGKGSFRIRDGFTGALFNIDMLTLNGAFTPSTSSGAAYLGTALIIEITPTEPENAFQPPSLLLPEQSAIGVGVLPNLTWSSVPGATGYEIQISETIGFTSSSMIVHKTVAQGSYKVEQPLNFLKQYYWRVKTISGDLSSNWSTPRTFTTIIDKPSTSLLGTPAADAMGVDMPLIFAWGKSDRARSYKLSLFLTQSGGVPELQFETSDTTFTITSLDPFKSYFWAVTSINDGGEATSIRRKFTTNQIAPVLTSPDNESIDVSVFPRFVWNSVSSATGYEYQISTTGTFESNDIIASGATAEASIMLQAPLRYYETYFWRVRALSLGVISRWSDSRKFKTIIEKPAEFKLVSPIDGAQGVDAPVLFKWDHSTRAVYYEVMIYHSSNDSTPISTTQTSDTLFVVDGLDSYSSYSWNVTAYNNGGSTPTPNNWSFVTRQAPPVLISPTTGERNVNPSNTVFIWSKVPRVSNYELQIASSNLFTLDSFVLSGTFSDTTLAVADLNYDKVYYWRVRSLGNDETSAWSTIRSFRTIIEKPGPFVLTSPINDSKDINTTTLFTWSESPRASGYTVMFYESLTSESPVLVHSLSSIEVTVSELNNFTTYFWTVSAENEGGVSEAAEKWSFRTRLETPKPNTPADGSVSVSRYARLGWGGVYGAANYEVQIANDLGFIDLVRTVESTDTSVTMSRLESGKTYYWRVRAVNMNSKSPYSSAFVMTTGSSMMNISESMLDFGKSGRSEIVDRFVRVSNTGTDTLFIESIISSLENFSLSVQKLVIAPAKWVDVQIRFQSDVIGKYEGILTFRDESDVTKVVNLKAFVGAVNLSFSASPLNVGSVKIGELKRVNVTLQNTGNDTLRITSVVSTSNAFASKLRSLTLLPGASEVEEISFAPTLNSGSTGKIIYRQGSTRSDTLHLFGNTVPIATPLSDRRIVLGRFDARHRLNISGSGSIDPDGQSLMYKWVDSRTREVLSMQRDLDMEFSVGTRFLRLIVEDEMNARDSSSVRVDILSFTNELSASVMAGFTAFGDSSGYQLYVGDGLFTPGVGSTVVRMSKELNPLFTLTVPQSLRTAVSVSSDSMVFITNGPNLSGFTSFGLELWGSKGLAATATATPTIDQKRSRIYVGVSNRNFLAFNYLTGVNSWAFFADAPISASAVITRDDKLIFPTQRGTLYGFDLTRSLSGNNIQPTWVTNFPDSIIHAPAIDATDNIVVGTTKGSLLKLFFGSAGLVSNRWDAKVCDGITASPVIDSAGAIYVVCKESILIKVDPVTGDRIWTFTVGGTVLSTPAISDYGTIYVATTTGLLYALDAESGSERWMYDNKGIGIRSDLLHVSGTTYLGTMNGKLLAFYDNGGKGNGSLQKSSGHDSVLDEPSFPQWGTFMGNVRRTGYASDTPSLVSIENTLEPGLPTRTTLSQSYPNPFNPSTVVGFQLSVAGSARLIVYDLLGRQVAVLVNGTMPAGRHQVTFDAAGLASGVYLVRLEAGGEVFTRRMTLLK
jgi:outer membrane protein assembly factor BamB